MDLWYFFTSKGLQLLSKKGYLSFIAPNNWMTTAGGKNMRKHIATGCRIKKFITFNNVMVFESASQQTMVFLLENSVPNEPYRMDYKAVGNRALNATELSRFLRSDDIGTHYSTLYDPILNADGRVVQFLDARIGNVAEKIKSANCFYLMNDEILNGIHPHHAEVTKKMLPLLPEANIGDGIFILKTSELSRLELPKEEMELIRPYYDSKNISRYFFNPANEKYIIYTTSEFKDPSFMDNYPKIKEHLDKYVSVITSDNRPYGLHRARKQEFFDEPAIISLRKCLFPQFSYVESQAYVTAEWYLIKTKRVSMKYLTCLLNSTLVKFWLLKMGKMQGNVFQVDKEPLVNIPILVPESKMEYSLSMYCDEIYRIRATDKEADISAIEQQIDKMIYTGYGLSNQDVAVIEEVMKAWHSK